MRRPSSALLSTSKLSAGDGPYTVTEVIRPGAYRLKDDNGNVSPTLGTSNNYVVSSPKNLVLPLSFIQRLLLQAP